MKILIWTQYFWPENFHINAVARCLHAQGVEVTVLTGKPNYPEGKIFAGYRATGIFREQYSGFEVIRIPLRQRGKNSSVGLAFNYLSFIVSGYLFAPYALRSRKFDAVFVYAPSPLLQALPAIFVAWLKGAPLILWVQDVWPDALEVTGFIKKRWILAAVGLAVRYVYQFSDLILVQSEGFRAFVERWTNKKEAIAFHPNSSDEILFKPEMKDLDSGIAKTMILDFAVVFAGNIGTAQSCETIIEAACLLRDIPNIKFYLIGGGSMVESICESVKYNQLENVVMTGRVPPEEMGPIYAAASALLLTLRDQPALSSTLPSKLQSYLAAGKPIIASCNGESVKIVNDADAGITCPAGDSRALAAAVRQLYAMSAAERSRFGKNGRKYFESYFDLQVRVKELIAHFRSVCAASVS